MSHYLEARTLMDEFPEETKDYTTLEVLQLWESYSDLFAAGWLIPDQHSVEQVFKPKGQS